MGLFRKKEQKNSKAFVTITGTRSAVFTGTQYITLAKEGYQINPYIYSCISTKVIAAQSIPWKLFSMDDKGDKTEVFKHPALDLIKNPNPFYGFEDFIEWFILSLDLDGNSYTEKVKGLNGTGEIYVLRPDKVDILYNSGNKIEPVKGYEWRSSGTVDYEFDEVIHVKNVNPLDDKNNLGKGQATLSAAARSGDQNNESRKWNVSLLQNGAVPSGIISSKGETDLDSDQVDLIKSQFREHYTGPDNAGEPLVLGFSDWKQMGMTAKDLDWKEGTAQSGREICSVLKVPSILIGDPSAKTYNNYKEARKALFIDGVIPVLNKMIRSYNRHILSEYKENLFFELDLMSIDVIREDKMAMWDRLKGSTFITENQKREFVGLGKSGPELDVYLWPSSIQVVPENTIDVVNLLGDDE